MNWAKVAVIVGCIGFIVGGIITDETIAWTLGIVVGLVFIIGNAISNRNR